MNILSSILPFIPIIIIAVALIAILATGYVKSSPDVAYIISGPHKKPRILIGKSGIKIPFFEKLDKLSLGAIQIDVKTRTAVPTAEYINVKVDSTVSVQVGRTDEMIALAAQNFLNVKREVIAERVNDLLEGNIREIVGQMKLTEMVSDRKAFSEKVQQNVVPDLARFGLELVSFNVQNFSDEGGVIDNLGIDNVEQIRKNAAIAKSDAQREIAVAEAANAKKSNDAKVQAAEEIAVRNNEFEMKQADLKKTADTAKAQANAAQAIEEEKQRQLKDVAATEADIARQEKQIELKEREVAIKERALEAEVKKTAEAEKYAVQQRADAKLYEMLQEAEGIRAKGEAEAAAIRAKLEAEAEGLQKKAEAMKQYGEAAKQDMQLQALKVYFEQLPAIAEAVGKGYTNVDKIMMFGGDTSKLAGDIMTNVTQVSEGLSESLGIDLKTLLAGFMGGNLAANKGVTINADTVVAPTEE